MKTIIEKLKRTCVICAASWDDFHEQLCAACESRGVRYWDRRYWHDIITEVIKKEPLEVKVVFK